MKTEHYPSLELCKKLAEAGFNETEIKYRLNYEYYVYPSIAELLDEMPDMIRQDYQLYIWRNNDNEYGVTYKEVNGEELGKSGGGFLPLPNALAEMWLWLKDNNYLE